MPEEKKARTYWMKRFLENAGQTHEAVDKATETLREVWAATIRDMENDINGWYSRFATEQGLTMAEARRQMTVKELAGLKLSLREFEKLAKENANGKWEQELSVALARVRISRLEAMQLSLRNYLWEAYQDTHNAASEALRDAYTSEYYHNTYETQRAEGKFSPVEEIPTAQIDVILSKPWASDGWEWSSRIWDNREKLTNELQGELLRSIVQGKGPVEAAARLASKMGVGQYQAVRLIQTEATAVATMADRDSFQSLGVEKVEYVATLEAHTCPTCGGLDGKIFTLKEVAAGMTAPPMHPNCRCTLVPYFEDEKGRRWMKDPETLERKIVKNITFEEWKKQYIKPSKKEEPKPSKPVEPPKPVELPKTKEPPKVAEPPKPVEEKPASAINAVDKYFKRKEKNSIILPKAGEVVIDKRKFTEYSLNPEKSPDKAKAFKLALGYDLSNWKELDRQIKEAIKKYPAKEKGPTQYGERYEVIVKITGPNGKSANVATGWILDAKTGEMRLTSAYITKKAIKDESQNV